MINENTNFNYQQNGNQQGKFCSACGTNISQDITFCHNCGVNLTTIQQNQPQYNYNQQYQQQNYNYNQPQNVNPQQNYYGYINPPFKANHKKFPIWAIVLLSVMAFVIGIGIGTMFLFSATKDITKEILITDKQITSNYDDTFPNGYSSEELLMVEIGMTYARVSSIIGGDGTLVEAGENTSEKEYLTYMWIKETDKTKCVYITFTSEKVSEIVEGDTIKQ